MTPSAPTTHSDIPEFTALIPARMASTRLPDKPLADILGQPMVVRVARQAQRAGAQQVCVATDASEIVAACQRHDVPAVLTSADHASGTDRLAEAATALQLPDDAIVVNVQGDEPLIDPQLITAVATLLARDTTAAMATAAHPVTTAEALRNPNVVKVVTRADGSALLFSRAPLPWWRDGAQAGQPALPRQPAALHHIGIYAYRAAFLRAFAQLPPCALEQCEGLEQLRALWHGHRIAVHVAAGAPGPGVDTAEDLARVRAILERRRQPATHNKQT